MEESEESKCNKFNCQSTQNIFTTNYNQSSQNVKSNLTNRYHHNSNLQIKNKSNFRKDKENKKSINRKVTFLIN